MTKNSNDEILLVCDLNIFIMAYLFHSAIMLSSVPYQFGKIFIHQTVYDELSEWMRSSAKISKFGSALIQSMLDKCAELSIEKPILADKEEQKYFSRISRVERALSVEQISTDTSRPDKMYLTLAMKLGANLATQERTLRNISIKTIGEKRLFSFFDMVVDRYKSNHLSKVEIEESLDNLKFYDENFISGNRKLINELINKGNSN